MSKKCLFDLDNFFKTYTMKHSRSRTEEDSSCSSVDGIGLLFSYGWKIVEVSNRVHWAEFSTFVFVSCVL